MLPKRRGFRPCPAAAARALETRPHCRFAKSDGRPPLKGDLPLGPIRLRCRRSLPGGNGDVREFKVWEWVEA